LGIRMTAVVGMRFRSGVGRRDEVARESGPSAAPWSAVVSASNLGAELNPLHEGLYLLAVSMRIPAGVIVSGPEDRSNVGLRNTAEGLTYGAVSFKVYNQDAGVGASQNASITTVLPLNPDDAYRVRVTGFNISGTLSTPDISITAPLIPLSPVENNPAPPGLDAWEDA